MGAEVTGMDAPDRDRLDELILYIARRSEGDAPFSTTKLWKLLFFTDFEFFQAQCRSVTGQTYHKRPYGPVPDGADDALADLQARQHLVLAQRTFGGKPQEKPLALREPRLELFTGPEIAHVDEIISRFWGATATAMSNLSHEFTGWQIVGMGKAIPYELALIDDSPLTEDDLAYADELVKAGRLRVPAGADQRVR
jgi:hypothetical protein